MRSSVVALGVCAFLACSKPAQSDTRPSLVPTAAAGQQATPSKDVVAALNAYEGLRHALASDDLQGAQTKAKQLADAATAAAKSSAGFKAVADAASAEAALATTDALAVRKQFGEVSRHFIAVLVADAALQQGRFIFECPMAPGYGKWVQTQSEVANPYMGKKMLSCGASTSWSS